MVGAISTDVLGNLYSTMNELELGADDLVAIAGCGPMGLAGGNHGVVAQIGEPGDQPITINPSEQLIRKKLTYLGSWYFKLTEWDQIIDFILAIGNDKAERIVSRRYRLEEEAASEGFRLFSEHKTLKVVFTP